MKKVLCSAANTYKVLCTAGFNIDLYVSPQAPGSTFCININSSHKLIGMQIKGTLESKAAEMAELPQRQKPPGSRKFSSVLAERGMNCKEARWGKANSSR